MKTMSFVLDAERPEISDDAKALDSDNTLVLAFASTKTDENSGAWSAIRGAFGKSKILGCSTAGEIEGTLIHDNGIVVAVAKFEDTKLRTAHLQIATAEDSFQVGGALIDQLSAPDLKAVFVLSEGLGVNGSQLIEGMNSRAAPGVAISGGLAGDGDRFERTWTVVDGGLRDRTVAAVGMYGESLTVGHGSKGGWDGFGMHRKVSKSADNVLHELNGKPALAVYKEYLGELAAGLPANALLFPLAVHSKDSEDPVVRTVLSIDEEAQTMTFAGDIPEGANVQFMRASFDRLIEGAAEAGRLTSISAHGVGDSLSIAISCVGRRLVLGERAEEEVESALDALPRGTTLVGFYSYGELSPHCSGPCRLHNQTMTLTTFLERAA